MQNFALFWWRADRNFVARMSCNFFFNDRRLACKFQCLFLRKSEAELCLPSLVVSGLLASGLRIANAFSIAIEVYGRM